jgi:hypothetical protein
VRNISDGALIPNEVLGTSIFQVLVEDAIEAFCFVLVAIDAVLYLLWSVSGELYS